MREFRLHRTRENLKRLRHYKIVNNFKNKCIKLYGNSFNQRNLTNSKLCLDIFVSIKKKNVKEKAGIIIAR